MTIDDKEYAKKLYEKLDRLIDVLEYSSDQRARAKSEYDRWDTLHQMLRKTERGIRGEVEFRFGPDPGNDHS